MPKVITIRDDVYKRLHVLKLRLGLRSFSQTLEWLMDTAERSMKKGRAGDLAGILEEGSISRGRLWRLKHVKDMLRP